MGKSKEERIKFQTKELIIWIIWVLLVFILGFIVGNYRNPVTLEVWLWKLGLFFQSTLALIGLLAIFLIFYSSMKQGIDLKKDENFGRYLLNRTIIQSLAGLIVVSMSCSILIMATNGLEKLTQDGSYILEEIIGKGIWINLLSGTEFVFIGSLTALVIFMIGFWRFHF